jgi:hypothetical protein
VDRHHIATDPDPYSDLDPNFHVNTDPDLDPDPDWHHNDVDPHADLPLRFTHFTIIYLYHQCQKMCQKKLYFWQKSELFSGKRLSLSTSSFVWT